MLRTLFILSILVPGFFLSLRNRYVALLMYLWFALFRPQDWLWVDITSLRMSLVLGIILVVPGIASGLFPNVTNPLSVGMIGFLLCSLVTQSVAVRPDIGWTWLDFMARLFLASTMIMTLASTPKRLAGVVAVISGSLAFHAAKAGLAFILGGGTRFADGLAGAFVDNNGYALGTVMIMPLLIAAGQGAGMIYQGRWLKWIQARRLSRRPAVHVRGHRHVFPRRVRRARGGRLPLRAAAAPPTIAVGGLATAIVLLLLVVPIPQSYLDRLQTIQTYKETGEESALSRWHFWAVALRMVEDRRSASGCASTSRPTTCTTSRTRATATTAPSTTATCRCSPRSATAARSSWLGMFGYAVFACLRVRYRSRDERLDPDVGRFLWSTANGLLVSMFAFVIGGSFLSLALNDVTWLTFGMVGALELTTIRALAEADEVRPHTVPLAFRAVHAFNMSRVSV
jgi:hypothetical protein